MQNSEGKMNITSKLQELQKEILSFGDVVSHAENPADIDFKNACDLFSQHLSYELKSINDNIRLKDIRPETQQTTSQLLELNELITPVTSGNNDDYQWSGKLLNFCAQLQELKSIAA